MAIKSLEEPARRLARLIGGDEEAAELYRDRPMRDGYPGLERLADEYFAHMHGQKQREDERLTAILDRLGRLVSIRDDAHVAIIGCGPVPQPVRLLSERGYHATGIEPVPSFVTRANAYLEGNGVVSEGAAESLPLDDETQDVVFMVSVLEHVDSPQRSLAEVARVLKPGGVLYASTTNRQFLGYPDNREFRVPLFGKLPRLVKECYIFRHLHYEPTLANYTQRPAVHWFSYADLCELGREAGFCQFYSPLDLRRPGDPLPVRPVMRFAIRRMLGMIQRSPWLRALALTQVGGTIIMLKRG